MRDVAMFGMTCLSGICLAAACDGLSEMTSRQAEKSAAVEGVEALGVDRYTFKRTDPKGVVLGFAAYPESAIQKALIHSPRRSAEVTAGDEVEFMAFVPAPRTH
jgi:hypothetical protein